MSLADSMHVAVHHVARAPIVQCDCTALQPEQCCDSVMHVRLTTVSGLQAASVGRSLAEAQSIAQRTSHPLESKVLTQQVEEAHHEPPVVLDQFESTRPAYGQEGPDLPPSATVPPENIKRTPAQKGSDLLSSATVPPEFSTPTPAQDSSNMPCSESASPESIKPIPSGEAIVEGGKFEPQGSVKSVKSTHGQQPSKAMEEGSTVAHKSPAQGPSTLVSHSGTLLSSAHNSPAQGPTTTKPGPTAAQRDAPDVGNVPDPPSRQPMTEPESTTIVQDTRTSIPVRGKTT